MTQQCPMSVLPGGGCHSTVASVGAPCPICGLPSSPGLTRGGGFSGHFRRLSVIGMVPCLPDTLFRGWSRAIHPHGGDPEEGSANLLEHTLNMGNTREVKNYLTRALG